MTATFTVSAELVTDKVIEYFNEDFDRLDEYDRDPDDKIEYFEEVAGDFSELLYGKGFNIDGIDFVQIKQVGGEGEGEEYFVVFQIVQTGQFFRFDGYYSSFDGVNWEDASIREVKAVERTVVFYE